MGGNTIDSPFIPFGVTSVGENGFQPHVSKHEVAPMSILPKTPRGGNMRVLKLAGTAPSTDANVDGDVHVKASSKVHSSEHTPVKAAPAQVSNPKNNKPTSSEDDKQAGSAKRQHAQASSHTSPNDIWYDSEGQPFLDAKGNPMTKEHMKAATKALNEQLVGDGKVLRIHGFDGHHNLVSEERISYVPDARSETGYKADSTVLNTGARKPRGPQGPGGMSS